MTPRACSIAVTAAVTALVALASCSDEARVILHVKGDLAAAHTVEVILAAPVVAARSQRTGQLDLDGGYEREVVSYLAQVDEVDPIELANLSERHENELVIQLSMDPGERFVPVVVARDVEGAILAMGLYDPPSMFDRDRSPSFIESVRPEVRVYDIGLEPTAMVPRVTRGFQEPGEVMVATCGDDDAPRGLVWRLASGRQLRLLLIDSPGPAKATKALAAPDLDCDDEPAGIAGPGPIAADTPRDCDDLDPTVRPGARELCNGHDDDCDDRLDGIASSSACATCATAGWGDSPPAGVCDEGADRAAPAFCMGPEAGLSCRTCEVDYQVVQLDPDRISVCGGATVIEVDGCGTLGCVATLLEVAPGWSIAIGAQSPAMVGLDTPVVIQTAEGTSALLFVSATAPGVTWSAVDLKLGYFTVHVQRLDGEPSFAWTVQLSPSPTSQVCAGLPNTRMFCGPVYAPTPPS